MDITYDSNVGSTIGKTTYSGPRVGIELEYENCKSSLEWSSDVWRGEVDHSLRTGGLELVSVPLRPDQVDTAVDEALSLAKFLKAKATLRCGLHVHVNVSHLSWNEMFRFITYYTLLEPQLFKDFAAGREMSHFCVPTWTNTVLADLMYKDGQRLRSGIHVPGRGVDMASWFLGKEYPGGRCRLSMLNTPKYAALNLNSLKKFGTLEFRQAPSSLNDVFIKEWVHLLLAIQAAALEYSDATDIIKQYDVAGTFTLCERVGFTPKGLVDTLDQEDAVDTATIIAGHLPVDWKDLSWEMS